MESISDLNVLDVSGPTAKVLVSYRWGWDSPGLGFGGGDDQGTATVEKIGSSYGVLGFETDGATYGSPGFEPGARQETQTALLVAPSTASIVVDKAEVEKDDHLKSVIRKYFNRQKFQTIVGGTRTIELINFEDLSVKSISGTTFTVDVKYRAGSIGSGSSKLERATSKIEKTADSYKIISFDRKRYNANPLAPTADRASNDGPRTRRPGTSNGGYGLRPTQVTL